MAAAASRRLGKRDFGCKARLVLPRAPVGAVLRRRRRRGLIVSRGSITPLVSVYDGRDCLGFILARGKLGFEALDRDERSLGLFPTQREAAQRIMETVP